MSFDTIDISHLAEVVGGKKSAPKSAAQAPDAGAQPPAGGGFDQFLAMVQQGLGNAGTFISGLQQIVQAFAGFAQMFQSSGQAAAPQAAQPDDQAA